MTFLPCVVLLIADTCLLAADASWLIQDSASVCFDKALTSAGQPPCWGWRRESKVRGTAQLEVSSSYGEGTGGSQTECDSLPLGAQKSGGVNIEIGKLTNDSAPSGQRLSVENTLSLAAFVPRAGFFLDAGGRFIADYDSLATRFLLPGLPVGCSTKLAGQPEPRDSSIVSKLTVSCPLVDGPVILHGTLTGESDGSAVTASIKIDGYILLLRAPQQFSKAAGATSMFRYTRAARKLP